MFTQKFVCECLVTITQSWKQPYIVCELVDGQRNVANPDNQSDVVPDFIQQSEGLHKEDHNLKVSLGYIVRPHLEKQNKENPYLSKEETLYGNKKGNPQTPRQYKWIPNALC